jgi:hypothetical protein
LIGVAVLLLVLSVHGEPQTATVKYLETEVIPSEEDLVIVRGAFEITGPRERWYTVYFQLRLDAQTPLMSKSDKGENTFVKPWGSIFTPGNVKTARYTDCRLSLSRKEIAKASNLPRGKRTVLWAVCDIWDDSAKAYLGSGWDARDPLIVSADDAGNIVKIESFHIAPFAPKENNDSAKIDAKEATLSLRNLKLKPDAKLYRAVGSKLELYNILIAGDSQAELESRNRGFFFEPIDSAEKAAELVKVGYPGAVIIKSAEQYRAIVNALEAKGWESGEDMSKDMPASYGIAVTLGPDLGYRVRMLTIDYTDLWNLGLQNIMFREFMVSPDGRIGIVKEIECVRAPEPETSRPPGWTQLLPLNPKPYNEVLRAVLTPEGTETIPNVILTDVKVAIPRAWEDFVRSYLKFDEWPDKLRRNP